MKYRFLLFALVVFHVFCNSLWISLNNVPPTWDAALHTILSIKFYEYLGSHLVNFNLVDFLKISEYYPPFVHWVGAVLAFVGQEHYRVVALTGTIFLGLAIVFQYLYSGELFQNKRLGLFAAFFFSFFLTIFQQSRDHMLDIPLTALVLASLYFLHKSRLLLFFIFAALAFLTKWYALLYLLIPFVLNFRLSKKMLAGIGIFGLITTPWYLVNFSRFVEISRGSLTPEAANPQNLFSLINWTFNLGLIINFQIFFAGFIFFLFSLFLIAKNHFLRPAKIVLGILLLNYVVFSLILTKNVRYTIPLMPFIAMIMAYGADYLWQFGKAKIIVILLLAFYFFSYLVLSFGIPIKPNFKYSLFGLPDLIYLSDQPVKAIFDTNPWPNEQILKDVPSKDNRVMLLNLSDRGYLNGYNLDPYLYADLPRESRNIQLFFLPFLDKYQEVPNEIDYALVPEKYTALPEGSKQFENLERFRKLFLTRNASNFKIVKVYSVTGDYFHPELFPQDRLFLYKKTDSR